MELSDLQYSYPESLVATERQVPSRVLYTSAEGSRELVHGLDELCTLFQAGDVLVLNETKVLKRRVFTTQGLEILFLKPLGQNEWQVLCPVRRWKKNEKQILPAGVELELVQVDRTQVVRASQTLTESYFETNGEMPLPPYIQKARGERHARTQDDLQYQTAWARHNGSLAAPTASLHFTALHLAHLQDRGVHIEKLTLHVGLGTFLPITVPRLEDHVMHAEVASISATVWERIQEARQQGQRIWALGTTVARALESIPQNKLHRLADKSFEGETDLYIRPGFEYQVIDRLLTNFHQPQSTLLALVAAFAGLERVQSAYQQAIAQGFRLFSYGDLSVWTKQ